MSRVSQAFWPRSNIYDQRRAGRPSKIVGKCDIDGFRAAGLMMVCQSATYVSRT